MTTSNTSAALVVPAPPRAIVTARYVAHSHTHPRALPGPPSTRPMGRPRPMPRRTLREIQTNAPVAIERRLPQRPQALFHAAPPKVATSAVAAPVQPPPIDRAVAVASVPCANALLLRGEYWEVRYGGRSALVEDCRGLRYIALLIRDGRADRGPIHAKELVARAAGQEAPVIELEARDAVLDPIAQAQFVKRLEEIGFARVRASAADDFDTLAALDEEYERIAEQLTRAAGGRGRRGSFGDAGEKARKAVGKAISEAIARLATHAELTAAATHFSTAIRKGQWLSYNDSLPWDIEFQPPLPRK